MRIERATPADARELKAQLRDQARAVSRNDQAGFIALDDRMHQRLVAMSGRPNVWHAVEDVKAQLDRVRFLSLEDPRWLASIPDFRYDVILGRFREMLGWGKRIINYHPGWLPKEIHSLNRALGLKYKLSKYYLTEPETPEDSANALKIEFGEMFNQGLMG